MEVGAEPHRSHEPVLDAHEALLSERATIDSEFEAAGLPAPEWIAGDAPELLLKRDWPTPWTDAGDVEQRVWFGRTANQFVNSLRPRLLRLSS